MNAKSGGVPSRFRDYQKLRRRRLRDSVRQLSADAHDCLRLRRIGSKQALPGFFLSFSPAHMKAIHFSWMAAFALSFPPAPKTFVCPEYEEHSTPLPPPLSCHCRALLSLRPERRGWRRGDPRSQRRRCVRVTGGKSLLCGRPTFFSDMGPLLCKE